MERKYLLHNAWEFALAGNMETDSVKKDKWHPASVPGTVHTDLLANGLIDEPFAEDNELRLQWIGDTDWKYRTAFNLPKDFDKNTPVSLVFDGLDTIAEIFLNGKSLGTADNMFLRFSFDVTRLLESGKNTLEVYFTSAVTWALEKEKKHGMLPVELRSERVYIRKAQYSFGWDWGPCFITCGIWRSVYLLQHTAPAVEKVFFKTSSVNSEMAAVEVQAEFSEKLPKDYSLHVKLDSGDGYFERTLKAPASVKAKCTLEVISPRLWQPNGTGEPFLYDLIVRVLDEKGTIVSEVKKKAGIRTIDLKLEDNGSPCFRLVVNGNTVFAQGANWIPSDSFLPRVSEAEYRSLLMKAKEASMNIIRVWGGGIYENDIFYDICDELGLMVWQDFMFACASYPETPEFIKNVKQEAQYNIERLQYHASLVIWCGNNENEWIYARAHGWKTEEMPGYSIYHKVLPGMLKGLDPARPYWPSTPFGDDADPNSQTSGNRHQWDLWSGWVDYKDVKKDESLFVTEFGFQGPANFETFKKVIPKKERHPQSRLFEFHNKQMDGPGRLYKFLISHLPLKGGFKDFLYIAQLSQGLALSECIEHWRMRAPFTSGSIIWQLNDCWPVTSWSLIDSEETPKIAWYLVRNSFSPQLISFRPGGSSVKVMVSNNTPQEFKGRIRMGLIHLPGGRLEETNRLEAAIMPFTVRQAADIKITGKLEKGKAVLFASLIDESGKEVSRNVYSPWEWKHLELPEADIKAVQKRKGKIVLNTGK
ncbi:MAG: glycoside hydrolase family 2 protein, partial [Syntrophothermus sp.]